MRKTHQHLMREQMREVLHFGWLILKGAGHAVAFLTVCISLWESPAVYAKGMEWWKAWKERKIIAAVPSHAVMLVGDRVGAVVSLPVKDTAHFSGDVKVSNFWSEVAGNFRQTEVHTNDMASVYGSNIISTACGLRNMATNDVINLSGVRFTSWSSFGGTGACAVVVPPTQEEARN